MGKLKSSLLFVMLRSQPPLTVNFRVYFCGILYFKINGIDAITKSPNPELLNERTSIVNTNLLSMRIGNFMLA